MGRTTQPEMTNTWIGLGPKFASRHKSRAGHGPIFLIETQPPNLKITHKKFRFSPVPTQPEPDPNTCWVGLRPKNQVRWSDQI